MCRSIRKAGSKSLPISECIPKHSESSPVEVGGLGDDQAFKPSVKSLSEHHLEKSLSEQSRAVQLQGAEALQCILFSIRPPMKFSCDTGSTTSEA